MPTDPLDKQQFLAAHALTALIQGEGGRAAGAPELVVVVVVDARDPGSPVIDWGLPIEVPERVLRDLLGHPDTVVTPVVVRNGVVLYAPGELSLGRSTRLANRWRHGGRTDLENLIPLCSRHHHAVHDSGWQLRLAADRSITVTLPDGSVLATGPPTRGGP